MPDYVSGWHDEKSVYLVQRTGDAVQLRTLPAKWSAFVMGLDDDDRHSLQRDKAVIGLSIDDAGYTRLDFASRWDRKRVIDAIDAAMTVRTFSSRDDEPLGDFGIFEGDVNPLRRMLSDHPGMNIAPSPRLGWFDLETDSRKSFDEAREGKAAILSWVVCSTDRSYIAGEVLEDASPDTERAFLARFYRAIERFDVMLAWSGDGFDFPVLEMRTQRLRVVLGKNRMPIWNRWCWLDALEVFKKYNQAHDSGEERANFKLNSIAQQVVGIGKDEFDSSRTWQAWAAGGEEREALYRYNVRDTELLPMIEEKTGFVALHLAVCHVTRCFPDSSSLGAAQQGDGFLLALGAKNGYRFKTKSGWGDRDLTPFDGAYVMAPKKLGLVENVHVCDFAGLYPSIMRSWNMSPDTLLSPRDVKSGEFDGQVAKLPDRNVHFRTDIRGVIPLALDQLVAQRGEYTKKADAAEPGSEDWERYKRLSSAFKIIANSFYGIVGSPFTRFFDRSIAEGVTQTGAWLIKTVARASEENGLAPFYGDTDSVFVQGDGDVFAELVKQLNAAWPSTLAGLGCTESRVKLEFEKSYRKLVLISAKRYAARYLMYKGKPAPEDMKPEVKGLEYKRGDVLRLAREMQMETLNLLLRDEVPSSAEARAIVDRWREKVLRGELALEDVMTSQSVKDLDEYARRYTGERCTNKVGKKSCGYDFGSKHVGSKHGIMGPKKCPQCKADRKEAAQPAHVRVAHVLKERGVEVINGTRIEYLVVLPADGSADADDEKLIAVPARDPGMFERIDRRYYWEKKILAPTQRVLEAVWPAESWKEAKPPKPVKEPTGKRGRSRAKVENGTLGLFAPANGGRDG